MTELWHICLSNRALIRGPKKSSLVLPSRLPRSEKSRIFLVSPTRASHHPTGFLVEALLEQAPPGCWILLQEQKSCSQAVRRDGNSPRDEKEAEMFLQHAQLAAAITGCQRELPQCPLGNCSREEMLGHRGGWHEAELCPTSAPVPEPCSKAFPGTLQSDSAPRQRAGSQWWIQGTHGINTKASGQSLLALPQTSPSPQQASASPQGSISSNSPRGWEQGHFEGLLLFI